MIDNHIAEMEASFSVETGTDAVYTIFMIIGIVGFFTVPTVASWIIQAGGAGSYNRNIQALIVRTSKGGANAAVPVASRTAGAAGAVLGNAFGNLKNGIKAMKSKPKI